MSPDPSTGAATGYPQMTSGSADRATFHASMTLCLALPADTVLYLLLPIHAAAFGVTLPEVGLLLAANRLVRIAGYSHVARLYAERGPRSACLLAAVGSVLAALGYALFSGVWALLVARLIWGLAFAAMNIAVHALPTAEISGAARRSGWSRSIIACGPMIGLAGGAVVSHFFGPRIVFLLLAGIAVFAVFFAAR
ncbi:MAG TPA: MFS transporter, partial [Hyphomicrobiaceae bacterium]|nr:MFS transporter [Hyphomicrobiaceae bacterium]